MYHKVNLFFVFFFQAEDGIRDLTVTGVQTRALPILRLVGPVGDQIHAELAFGRFDRRVDLAGRDVEALGVKLEVMDQRFHRLLHLAAARRRSEERRVGKEWRSGWWRWP